MDGGAGAKAPWRRHIGGDGVPETYHELQARRLVPLLRAFGVIATVSFAAFWWWDGLVYEALQAQEVRRMRLSLTLPLACVCALLFLPAGRVGMASVFRAYLLCLFVALGGVSYHSPLGLMGALPSFMALPIVAASMLTRWQDLVLLLAAGLLVPVLALQRGAPDAVIVGNYALYLAVSAIGAAILYVATERMRRRAFKLERALERAANTDALTGLLARRRFFELAAEHVRRDRDGEAALLYLDLDHFKRVNDEFGHEAGDDALRAVAHALREFAPGDALVSRLGGEEFVLLLPRPADLPAQAADLLGRIGALRVRGHALSTSLGAARQRGGESLTSLLMRADHALLQAKRDGRGCVRWAADAQGG